MERRWMLALLAAFTCVHVPGGVTAQSDSRPANPCAECERLADQSISDFTNYRFFIEYERDNLPKPWMRAGMKSCEEFRWAYQCFQHCKDELEAGVGYSYPPRYGHLESILSKYCEPEWSPSKSCRMADTRICDKLHLKSQCGDHLENYKKCTEDVLRESGQDCSGVCTPASRFYTTLLFQWDMECKLKNSTDGRCGDYVNLYCFGDLKDTDLSWAIFDNMNEDNETRNLENFCPRLEDPLYCLQETVDTWLLYFGFNMTKPCASVDMQIQEIKQQWSEIIHPFCEGRAPGLANVKNLCGEMPVTERIPSTTTTKTTSTLPTSSLPTTAPPASPTTKRITRKKIKRRRLISSSIRPLLSAALAAAVLGLMCLF